MRRRRIMQLSGIHHVTAVTGNASLNVAFYTQVLGMRLTKKTVNQDDVSAYHLFYGDELGRPGTEVTFFDWPMSPAARPGNPSIGPITLSVPSAESLEWWAQHLASQAVEHDGVRAVEGRATLGLRDFE